MRIFIFVSVLLAGSFLCKAQFILTPNGPVSSQDETKLYSVYDFRGLKQTFLFDEILDYAKKYFSDIRDAFYSDPSNFITDNDRDLITIQGKGIAAIDTNPVRQNIHYTLIIRVENEKVGYEIHDLIISNVDMVEVNEGIYIFTKTGEVNNTDLKNQVEDYLNMLINDLNTHINETSNAEWL